MVQGVHSVVISGTGTVVCKCAGYGVPWFSVLLILTVVFGLSLLQAPRKEDLPGQRWEMESPCTVCDPGTGSVAVLNLSSKCRLAVAVLWYTGAMDRDEEPWGQLLVLVTQRFVDISSPVPRWSGLRETLGSDPSMRHALYGALAHMLCAMVYSWLFL